MFLICRKYCSKQNIYNGFFLVFLHNIVNIPFKMLICSFLCRKLILLCLSLIIIQMVSCLSEINSTYNVYLNINGKQNIFITTKWKSLLFLYYLWNHIFLNFKSICLRQFVFKVQTIYGEYGEHTNTSLNRDWIYI